ncbi:MAG: hypothetical protein KAR40_05375 [Candidatus Sabulitectum sp.]|nr:hypothetical protein [Candidatus Sabulitectum sp.]
MSYSIGFDKKIDCIIVTVAGDFHLSAMQSLAAEVAKHLNEHGCRCILNDLRNAALSEPSSATYKMPEAALKAGVSRHIKRALVVSDLSSDFRFLETVFVNQGNIVKLFVDIDEARSWISPKSTDS